MRCCGDGSIIVCGLPEAGKTTYLAALWNVLQEPEVRRQHLASYRETTTITNMYARFTANGSTERRQVRTEQDERKPVGLDFPDPWMSSSEGHRFSVEFPDLGGEIFSTLWEERYCDEDIANLLSNRSGVILFVHADKIVKPRHLINELTDNELMGEQGANEESVPYTPVLSPCQVKIVDLLQSFQRGAIAGRVGRLSVVISAWDRVAVGDLMPERHLATHLPLLDQYLKYGAHQWEPAIFGISAQGADYVSSNHEGALPQPLAEICRLDHPYERIRVIYGELEDHDLTRPIAWVSG